MENYFLIGTWQCKIMVYSNAYNLIKVLKSKAAIRTIQISNGKIIVGQNDGNIDILDLKPEILVSK